MSALITLKNLALSYPQRCLFRGLSVSLAAGHVLALTGGNGSGKTTLLDLIVGSSLPDELTVDGECFRRPGTTTGYLRQESESLDLSPGRPVDWTDSVRSRRAQLLSEFAVSDETVHAGSEGERRKRAIVDTVCSEADLYLFDEPTNYLDIRGILAFERAVEGLAGQGAGIIMVTHDRRLADNLADESILLSAHGIYRADGGYSAVLDVKEESEGARAHQAEAIGRRIHKLEADIRAKAGWAAAREKDKIGGGGAKGFITARAARMARRARAVGKRLEREKAELKEARPFVPKPVWLEFPRYEIRHRDVFTLEKVAFAYPATEDSTGDCPPFSVSDITLAATTQSRICLVGANGSGKSTLLRLCAGSLTAHSGRRHRNAHVRTAWLTQGLDGFWSTTESLLGNFDGCDLPETEIRRYLGAVQLRQEKVHEPLSQFSQGELMRAALVRCVLSCAEFLFLDEPTTHLDLESLSVVERLLQDFQGGYLIVSHDRAFVENVAGTLYVIDDGCPRLV